VGLLSIGSTVTVPGFGQGHRSSSAIIYLTRLERRLGVAQLREQAIDFRAARPGETHGTPFHSARPLQTLDSISTQYPYK